MISATPFLAMLGSAASATVPPQPQLTEQIRAADAELFDLFFVRPCDAPKFRALLAPDVEFYHDKDGFNVHSADEFVAIYSKNCASRAEPTTWRSRRELVAASLHVDPIPGHGAIEEGDHLFYERHGVDGTEVLAGRARFAMVWTLDADGGWRVSRVLSYRHEAVK